MDKFLITLFFGWAGVHKFMDKKIGIGLLYLFTFGVFGIGWIVDIAISLSQIPPKKNTKETNTPYTDSFYSETDQRFAYGSASRIYANKYFKGMEEIETMWSVMYNLKIVTGSQADTFEEKCKENISDLFKMLEEYKKYGYNNTIPPHVPAYVRLAMLYEKQERYSEAIDVCVESIKAGAISDGNKGKMYGRLARLIRKSGITVSDDILALSMKQ